MMKRLGKDFCTGGNYNVCCHLYLSVGGRVMLVSKPAALVLSVVLAIKVAQKNKEGKEETKKYEAKNVEELKTSCSAAT